MRTTLYQDDVVFMYAVKDPKDFGVYAEYGATAMGWGGTHTSAAVRSMRERGIHATGTMWCLTAKAPDLHADADLRDAVVRDIAGEPIIVPWLFDYVHEGTPSWWGCTNHPAFRAHMRKKVCEAMAGDADGLHIDDHLGTAAAVELEGGCFCDWCMALFRRYLLEHSTPELLAKAGVKTFADFDYRSLVRRYATTRKALKPIKDGLPLWREFLDCQLQAAAENIRQLASLAREIVRREVTVSANTCLPRLPHAVVAPSLSYLVGEVEHHARSGTEKLLQAVAAYRMAEALGKVMAPTACGWDWAHIAERNSVNLVRLWIGLAYACGQCFMVPHRIWCFTEEKGTHWYDGPTAEYAPLYQFIRRNARLFRDMRTVGPLAAPKDISTSLGTFEERQRFQAALNAGDPRPLQAGERVWVFPRRHEEGSAVVHLVNVAYQADSDTVVAQRDVQVAIPKSLFKGEVAKATLHSYDRPPVALAVTHEAGQVVVRVPEVRLWGVVECG